MGLFADQAVFLGTDITEYWPIDVFREYVKTRFSTGTGWTYHSVWRKIHVNENTGWFEENLRHDKYGLTRGTGVLVKNNEGQWRIAQYHLTLPVPNELFVEVVEKIQDQTKTQ